MRPSASRHAGRTGTTKRKRPSPRSSDLARESSTARQHHARMRQQHVLQETSVLSTPPVFLWQMRSTEQIESSPQAQPQDRYHRR